MKSRLILTALAVLFNTQLSAEKAVKGKWYTLSQLELGKQVFEQSCMSCHGDKAQGLAANWKKPDTDGHYPPPPLDGSAHAWHHPISTLLRTIDEGGVALGGKMPGFADKLNAKEKVAVVAWFQNFWPNEVYVTWVERGGLSN